MYDVIIIGGGIAGLYCARELSKTKKILLCDDRNYVGGRIRTHTRPRYEIGAARFNDSHKKIKGLISEYGLSTAQLNRNYDFISKKTPTIQPNVNLVIKDYINMIIKKSKSFTKKQLVRMTFKEFCTLVTSKTDVNRIISYFGYTSEFEIMNAYDAIRSFRGDFNGKKSYYVLIGGLSQLCNNIGMTILAQGGKISLKTYVTNVNRVGDYFKVLAGNKEFSAKKVIFATKTHQLKSFKMLKPFLKEMNSVKSVPLIRIYAKYRVGVNGAWFKGLNRTTTDSFVRHIIPINEKSGLIMISYVDGDDTKAYIKHNKLLSDKIINKKIHMEICRLFPDKRIPKPIYFKVHLWTEGVHQWKKGVDSIKIHTKMINPIKNIYICGEGLSLNQAWIEGALDTAHKVVNKI